MIQSCLAQLHGSFGGGKPPVSTEQLRRMFYARDFTGMVGVVRDSLKLELRVRVGLVNDGGPAGAPAWVSYPSPLPRYGSPDFKKTVVTVFLRKSFIEEVSFEAVVSAMAHELSHITLFSVNHPLQACEEAVDLTAMLNGYRDLYVVGCETIKSYSVPGGTRTERYELGYLKPEEVRYAAGILGRRPENSSTSPASPPPRIRLDTVRLKLAIGVVAVAIPAWFLAFGPAKLTKQPDEKLPLGARNKSRKELFETGNSVVTLPAETLAQLQARSVVQQPKSAPERQRVGAPLDLLPTTSANQNFEDRPKQQPSFDCNKASTPVEQIICADADLMLWDFRLGLSFKRRMERLDRPARTALIKSEKEWVRLRNYKCDIRQDFKLSDISAVKPCLLAVIQSRTEALEAAAIP
jgi:uncharacterized protein YecT (DUF1311 family)